MSISENDLNDIIRALGPAIENALERDLHSVNVPTSVLTKVYAALLELYAFREDNPDVTYEPVIIDQYGPRGLQ